METRRRQKIQGLFCAALREAGVLTVVLSSLDAAFSAMPYPKLSLGGWALVGLLLLFAGVFFDPEIRG
jgi:predicted transporter